MRIMRCVAAFFATWAMASAFGGCVLDYETLRPDGGMDSRAEVADVALDRSMSVDAGPCGHLGESCCARTACVASTCVDGQCVVCGGRGMACCDGRCDPGIACANDHCVCGALHQPCCNGMCDAGTCIAGECIECGMSGQRCCGGSCESGFVCNGASGLCVGCGAVGQPCCTGDSCSVGATCTAGMCMAANCGSPPQPCCAGGTCAGTAVCQGGFCTTPTCGTAGQPCCGTTCATGTICSGGLCIVSSCGGETQPCCSTAPSCTPGTVCLTIAGTIPGCSRCGNPGQACCAMMACNTGTCMPVLGEGLDICSQTATDSAGGPCNVETSSCPAGTACRYGRCLECGEFGEPCCNGDACGATYRCQTMGGIDQCR